jgi:hypothetical protein
MTSLLQKDHKKATGILSGRGPLKAQIKKRAFASDRLVQVLSLHVRPSKVWKIGRTGPLLEQR